MAFSEGVTYFRIQAKDNLGNPSDWMTGFIFKYDKTIPKGAQASVAILFLAGVLSSPARPGADERRVRFKRYL